jgi:ATP-dependent DNA helicase RecG
MEAIASTDEGFTLAEEDLRLRGEGDILGLRQSGLPALRVASVATDAALLECAGDDAAAIIAEDPGLRAPVHAPLLRMLLERLGDGWEWVSSG